jgi:glycosyltransferase involved in cell wall biosynthesis
MNRLRQLWRRAPVPTSLRVARRAAGQYLWRARRAPAAWRHRRFEAAEVARLRPLLGATRRADVVTIIATYRRPDGLVAAVRSALAQGIDDHLVVVVDDGGGLPELPADRRVVVLSLSRNYGCLGMVRNVGIRLTDSRVLSFLDDDNPWRPDHLRRALDAIAAGNDLVYTDLHRVRADGTTLDVLSEPFDRRAMWLRSYVDSNALVLRRAPEVIFSRIPKQKEDWALVLRLSRRWRVAHVPHATVRYLVNPDSHYTRWASA